MKGKNFGTWNVLNQLNDLIERSTFDRQDFSSKATSCWAPAVDIHEEKDNYFIKADLPGVNQNDIEIFMDNGVLTIKGEREQETREDKATYSRTERICGTFHRQFALPDTADIENIQASYENGVLELRIPKKEAAKPKRISVSRGNPSNCQKQNAIPHDTANINDQAWEKPAASGGGKNDV